MSLFASLLISLVLFSGFVAAGIYAPGCSLNWAWSFNSLGQNPCTVAAYMLSTCHGGSFTVQPVQSGFHYTGPSSTQGGDLCLCNTIAYSLLSACDGCQGSEWISWSDYSNNCTTILPPSTFPNPVPDGTSLQRWAILDVTAGNNWNPNASQAVGGRDFSPLFPHRPRSPDCGLTPVLPFIDTPELVPGTFKFEFEFKFKFFIVPYQRLFGFSPAYKWTHSHAGAIAGGVVGGVGGIAILFAALLFCLRKRHPQAADAPSTSSGQPSGFNPLMDQAPHSPVQGTVTSSAPDTSTSGQRCPYLRTANTKECRRLRFIIPLCRLPRRPVEIFTPMPPRQPLKDREPFPWPELTVSIHPNKSGRDAIAISVTLSLFFYMAFFLAVKAASSNEGNLKAAYTCTITVKMTSGDEVKDQGKTKESEMREVARGRREDVISSRL
ncbi:hypothetical protein BGY98DRAFT_937561 [Russula aff. rugulosa BPL654]|nr:hypothetical protein BGY98DRAFT_937561 [Russula aff. rugulosa BPL654]